MPRLAHYARVFQPRERIDQERVVVQANGLFWQVTGEFTTPAPGRTPAFIASDIRLVNDDGSVCGGMLDDLSAPFVTRLELLAAEELETSPRAA